MLEYVSIELTGEPNAETEVEESDNSGDENGELQKRGNAMFLKFQFGLTLIETDYRQTTYNG